MTPWKDARLLILDVETTGLSPATGAIVQLGYVCVEGRKLVAAGEQLIDPEGRAISPEAGRVHGITAADVADAPTFADVAPGLIEEAGKCLAVVAYNAPFDESFLMSAAWRALGTAGIHALQRWRWLDPFIWIKHLDRSTGRMRLVDACLRRGIPFDLDKSHGAGYDTQRLATLLLRLMDVMPDDLDDLLATEERWRREHWSVAADAGRG